MRLLHLFVLICFFGVTLTPHATARPRVFEGPYPAEIYYITDGDTFFARVHIWPGLNSDVSIRINGIDTPETWRPKCEGEEIAGKAATEFLMKLFDSPYRGAVLDKPMAKVELRNVKQGKFAGRILADVFYNGKNVAQQLLQSGHARPYDGGTRTGWC
ncbi:thermonuclease family protein [Sneathiella glossodoripedis]|uniref:thermonuclease family protein n=1 Tax=Sneathiella glossodoripedis TaxID=418853 RepID=UPI00046F3A22|nr:thermonuclease family protein [Sneathiella glossodoripedis]